MNLQKVAALACVMTALFATPSTAEPTQSDWFSIASLAGGWVEGHLRVVSSGPFHNPSSCPYADGYVVDDSLPGAQLLQAMLITAYASGDQVQVTVDGCASGRRAKSASKFVNPLRDRPNSGAVERSLKRKTGEAARGGRGG